MKAIKQIQVLIWLIVLMLSNITYAQTTKTIGSGGDYSTLKLAFDAINAGTITGTITLQIIGSTTETAVASLNASGTGSANYTSINIYPTGSGYTIGGNLNSNLIDFNGADNVTINGSVNASGSTKDLIITNTGTGTVATTIRFYNSSENNNVKYCTLKGSGTGTGLGLISFGSSATGNGNDNNILEECNITNAGGNRPINALLSYGTSGRENSRNIIRDNNIYDFFFADYSSYGINVASNSTDWIIFGNSFYETTTFAPTSGNTYYPIRISTSSPHTISGNYIGGSSAMCGGSAFTVNANFSHYFCGIYINGSTTTPSNVQNNIIQNINYTSTQGNPWDGIYINSGNVNVTGNTIGATTGTGSIIISTPNASATAIISGGVVTNITLVGGGSGYTTAPLITFSSSGSTTPATATATISGGVVTNITINNGGSGYTSTPLINFDGTTYSTSHGMIQNSSGTVNITNNNIGSITTIGSNTYSHGFESIYVRGVTGVTTFTNNLIGSLTTPNSIYTSSNAALSPTKQDVYGLYSSSIGTTIMTENTIANITNAYTGINAGSKVRGIQTTSGSNTIQNNTVRNISTSSGQSGTKSGASIIGISQTSTLSGTTQIVNGNTVYAISNTNPTEKLDLYGIYFAGPPTGVNTVSGNFVHSLSISSSNILSDIEGILLFNGLTTCSNNIVNLGVDVTTGYKINGIWDESVTNNNNSIYFNSVYIGGTVSSAITSSTSSLKNNSNVAIRNYRNNVLFNARTGGTTGKHYAVYLTGTTGLTIDYNDYFVSGTNGVLGYLGTDKSTLALLRTATGQDANSIDINPGFTTAGGTTARSYNTSASLPGVFGTGVTTDYFGDIRNGTPKMGALETNASNYLWQGYTSSDFATASNWSAGNVPPTGADISFASNPGNNCVLDQNRTLGNITNSQSAYKLVVNGKQLTITGNIIQSNGASIDATTTSSVIIFAGASSQSISSGSFFNNIIDGLNVNNSNGLTLNGNLNVVQTLTLTNGTFSVGANTLTLSGNSLTRTSGNIDASNSNATIVFANTSAITLPPIIFSGNVNNLTINGAGGITAVTDFMINGILSLQSSNPSFTKGILDMWDGFVIRTLNMGENATTIGAGDVTGYVARTSTFVANKVYTFGNQFTTITLANVGTYPSQIQAKIRIGTYPSWETNAINRFYEFTQTGGLYCKATLATHYLDTELNGNTENDLVLWGYGTVPPLPGLKEFGRSNSNSADNWVSIANVPLWLFPSNFDIYQITLAKSAVASYIWNGSQSSSWITTGNWTPSSIPSSIHQVIIPDASTTLYSPTLPASTELKTLTIQTGGILNAPVSGQLTINGDNGAWNNSGGTFNPNTSNVIFTNVAATLSGTTNFYDVTISSGKELWMTNGSIMRIAGTMTNNGTWHTVISGTSIVEYNGENQTIVVPNPLTNRYYNLILSGSGTKTMPATGLNILGDYTTTGTVAVIAGASLTISGKVTIGNGTTFNTGSYNHSIGGDFDNNGTFTIPAGQTMTMNGTSSQAILGSTTTNYENLTINNINGVMVYTNANINNTLTLTNGNLNVQSVNLGINGTISKTSGYIEVSPISSLSFGGTTILTLASDLFNTLPSMNNLTINRTNNIILGQDLIINGTLTLTNGLIILGDKNLTLGSSAIVAGSPSANNMIVATSSGELRKIFDNEALTPISISFSYPVGDNSGTAEYSPVTLNFTSGTFSNAYAGVTLANVKHPNNTSTADYLNRYWTVNQSGISDFSCNVTFQYLPSDIVGTETNIWGGNYIGGSWILLLAANNVTHQLSGTVTGFSSFTGGQQSAMPVELSVFNSIVSGRDVKLNWVTASETNNAGFEIQKSTVAAQNSVWNKIGYINGSGTKNTPSNYSFMDSKLNAGKFQYRLKQIDNNGNFKYYALNIMVEIGVPNEFTLSQNYPNPFNPKTKIDFQIPNDAKVTMKIYDVTGREIATLLNNEYKKADYYTLDFNATNIASGVYFYRITADKFVDTKKMVMIK